MSKPVRWRKPHAVFAGLNKNHLKGSAHQISAIVLDESDGHVDFREQFPDSIGWISSHRILSKIYLLVRL